LNVPLEVISESKNIGSLILQLSNATGKSPQTTNVHYTLSTPADGGDPTVVLTPESDGESETIQFLRLTLNSPPERTQAASQEQQTDSNLSPEEKAQIASASETLKQCIRAARTNPKYAMIAPHFADVSAGYSADQLADETLPTEEEATLYAVYLSEAEPCRDAFQRKINSLNGEAGAMLSSRYSQGRETSSQFIARKITWGEYARRSQDLLKPANNN